ncbi:MAG: hypothetical protein OEV21_05290 [Thermoplasmata archaeon]|nr:hypothetical protein [Thermoplasmata archaeon]
MPKLLRFKSRDNEIDEEHESNSEEKERKRKELLEEESKNTANKITGWKTPINK